MPRGGASATAANATVTTVPRLRPGTIQNKEVDTMTNEKNETEIAESVRETLEIMSDPDLMREIALSRMAARAGMTVPWEVVRGETG